MTQYNTNDEIRQRLKTAGYQFFADDDYDGHVSGVDAADNITTASNWAGALVDEAVCGFATPSEVRAESNEWLKGRHLDLAAYRVSTMGGGDEIGSLKVAFEDAKAALDRVRGGQRVPGLTYPSETSALQRSNRFPVAVNWW